jgi:hypothetical protein
MPSTIHLANGEKIRCDQSPAEVNEDLSHPVSMASGLCEVESVTGITFVNPAQVTHIAEGGR